MRTPSCGLPTLKFQISNLRFQFSSSLRPLRILCALCVSLRPSIVKAGGPCFVGAPCAVLARGVLAHSPVSQALARLGGRSFSSDIADCYRLGALAPEAGALRIGPARQTEMMIETTMRFQLLVRSSVCHAPKGARTSRLPCGSISTAVRILANHKTSPVEVNQMERLFPGILLLILVGFGPIALAPAARAQSGCGLKPLKPLTPLGCKDLVASCVCDARGNNCHWEWVCVPK